MFEIRGLDRTPAGELKATLEDQSMGDAEAPFVDQHVDVTHGAQPQMRVDPASDAGVLEGDHSDPFGRQTSGGRVEFPHEDPHTGLTSRVAVTTGLGLREVVAPRLQEGMRHDRTYLIPFGEAEPSRDHPTSGRPDRIQPPGPMAGRHGIEGEEAEVARPGAVDEILAIQTRHVALLPSRQLGITGKSASVY